MLECFGLTFANNCTKQQCNLLQFLTFVKNMLLGLCLQMVSVVYLFHSFEDNIANTFKDSTRKPKLIQANVTVGKGTLLGG